MVILLVSLSLLILLLSGCLCLKAKRYLVALYTVCYSVPFLGLTSCFWSETVILWPIGGYEFYLDDPLVFRLALVWFLGVTGALVAYLFSLLMPAYKTTTERTSFFSPMDFKLAGILFFWGIYIFHIVQVAQFGCDARYICGC